VTVPRFLDADALASALSLTEAVNALAAALEGGLDPAADPPRSSLAAPAGELLLMPSAAAGPVGVKLASVAPANPARGLARIQGVYALFDAETLSPVALIDGIALTAVRTAAVSALAARLLAPADASRLLVFGTGPQARAHVEALAAVRPIERIEAIGRDPGRLDAFLEYCHDAGFSASAGDADAPVAADIVCCCTTAREPLFDGGTVGDDAAVIAIGSHEPEAREVDERLAARAFVVVEDRATALREAGDVVLAARAGALDPDQLVTLAQLARGESTPPLGRPRLFKSTGMAWEDAVVAAAAVRRG